MGFLDDVFGDTYERIDTKTYDTGRVVSVADSMGGDLGNILKLDIMGPSKAPEVTSSTPQVFVSAITHNASLQPQPILPPMKPAQSVDAIIADANNPSILTSPIVLIGGGLVLAYLIFKK